MISAPRFWSSPEGAASPAARLLAPLGEIYAKVVAGKLEKASPAHAPLPVICAGNISMGGVGKTPFVGYLAQKLTEMGHTPFILMRGYGGSEKGPLRVLPDHTAKEVGDEARMLARDFPVILSSDRPAGAALAAEEGASLIVMDDGFQNPSLVKDVTFLLVDGESGLGNGLVFPAGPLRERPEAALARASALVIVGGTPAEVPLLPPHNLPVFHAQLESVVDTALTSAPVHAFSGIGRPEKFRAGLEAGGVTVSAWSPFPDHHMFSAAEIRQLKEKAATEGAQLVTTEKDMARLSPEDAEGVIAVPARLTVDPDALLDQFLGSMPEPAR